VLVLSLATSTTGTGCTSPVLGFLDVGSGTLSRTSIPYTDAVYPAVDTVGSGPLRNWLIDSNLSFLRASPDGTTVTRIDRLWPGENANVFRGVGGFFIEHPRREIRFIRDENTATDPVPLYVAPAADASLGHIGTAGDGIYFLQSPGPTRQNVVRLRADGNAAATIAWSVARTASSQALVSPVGAGAGKVWVSDLDDVSGVSRLWVIDAATGAAAIVDATVDTVSRTYSLVAVTSDRAAITRGRSGGPSGQPAAELLVTGSSGAVEARLADVSVLGTVVERVIGTKPNSVNEVTPGSRLMFGRVQPSGIDLSTVSLSAGSPALAIGTVRLASLDLVNNLGPISLLFSGPPGGEYLTLRPDVPGSLVRVSTIAAP
jgi:hypothetical protein